MSHLYILSGSATGGPPPRELFLDFFQNVNTTYDVQLQYVERDELFLDFFQNVPTFYDIELENVIVTELDADFFQNTNEFFGVTLVALPYDPVNDETEALLAASTGTYSTTAKIQMDTLITNLKAAGVWARLDWYGNAHWAVNEHDALLNWVNPAQTLVKVGSASWTLGLGLSGVSPVTTNARYKSGWNVGSGPHSTATDVSMFVNITAISAPQNSMQPMGVWQLVSGGGPVTPDGMFIQLNVLAGTGFAGANLNNGNGNTGLTTGDGLGVWGVSHNGATQITVKDGVTQDTDAVTGNSTYTDADGMSVAGSSGLAKKSFPGTQLYWGWGQSLTAVQFGAIEDAYQDALTAPHVSTVDDALIVDGSDDWLLIDTGTNFEVHDFNALADLPSTMAGDDKLLVSRADDVYQVEAKDVPSGWSHVRELIRPQASDFPTWVNQNSSVITDLDDGVRLSHDNSNTSGTQVSARVRSLPGGSWDVQIGGVKSFSFKTELSAGLILRESATGKIMALGWGHRLVGFQAWGMYTNPTTAGTLFVSSSGNVSQPYGFFRFRKNGSNIEALISFDGENWTKFGSARAITSNFTTAPDQWGFYINTYNNESPATDMAFDVLHWDE